MGLLSLQAAAAMRANAHFAIAVYLVL